MVRKQDRTSWKADYFIRILSAFDEYPKCFIVNVDNVGSKQMQEIRTSLRGHAPIGSRMTQITINVTWTYGYVRLADSLLRQFCLELLMGKNTMIRKAIRGHLQQNPGLEKLLPFIVGNVGFVFTNEDLSDIKTKILENKVAAPAKVGSIAPLDVSIPPQNTGMGPEKTSFFQALNIPTKISRGTIEILNDVKLITEGEKVGASEATLLQMMDIKPFTYGLVILRVFDSGSVFEPEILDITDEDIRDMFLKGVRNVASVSLAIGYPTMASVPHTIATVFRNLLAIAAQTDVTFKEAETMKEYLADPSKAAEAVAALVAPAEAAPAQEAPKAAAPAEDSESDEDMGLGLFDD